MILCQIRLTIIVESFNTRTLGTGFLNRANHYSSQRETLNGNFRAELDVLPSLNEVATISDDTSEHKEFSMKKMSNLQRPSTSLVKRYRVFINCI